MAILSRDEIARFFAEGYLLLKHIIPVADLLSVRGTFEEAFKAGLWHSAPNSSSHIINDIYAYFPETLPILINTTLITAVRELTGEPPVWIPECSVHRNRYVGWHKDTSIQELNGNLGHRESAAPLIQCAIYFQENGPGGGGLTVIPGTHLSADRFAPMLTERLAAKAYYKILKTLKHSPFERAEAHPAKIDLCTAPGDILLFDVRIDHRSTPDSDKKAAVAGGRPDKLAVFNTFGGQNSVTRSYCDFMLGRPEPYYQYFRSMPVRDVVYEHAARLGVTLWPERVC